jgi:hypothetical protein
MQNNVLQVDRHSRRRCYVIDLFWMLPGIQPETSWAVTC